MIFEWRQPFCLLLEYVIFVFLQFSSVICCSFSFKFHSLFSLCFFPEWGNSVCFQFGFFLSLYSQYFLKYVQVHAATNVPTHKFVYGPKTVVKNGLRKKANSTTTTTTRTKTHTHNWRPNDDVHFSTICFPFRMRQLNEKCHAVKQKLYIATSEKEKRKKAPRHTASIVKFCPTQIKSVIHFEDILHCV